MSLKRSLLMLDPSARRSRRSAGSLQAHRGGEGVAVPGLRRPGKVFGQFQYPTVPLHSTDERQREIADALGDLAAGELKRKPSRARKGTTGSRFGHATGTTTEKRLMKINKRAGETASDLQLRLGGAKRARTADPLLAKCRINLCQHL